MALGIDGDELTQVDVGDIERHHHLLNADNVRLSLHDGKRLLDRVQLAIVRVQAHKFSRLYRVCLGWQRGNRVEEHRQREADRVPQ